MIAWLRDLLTHPNRIHYPGPGVPPRYNGPTTNLVEAAERALKRD